jgi:protein ImuB
VQIGMPTAEAMAILAQIKHDHPVTCPSILPEQRNSIELYDPLADRKALQQLAQWCHRYSPTAGLEEAEAPETLLLDATNLAPLYGSEEVFVQQVMQGFSRLGLEARAALAATIGAAWALAHYSGEGEPSTIKATGSAGGPCLRHETNFRESTGGAGGFYHAALAPLPIAALRLPGDLLETLTNLGATFVGDLLALPREQLRSRFGPLLLTRIDQALGSAREVFATVDPPEEFVVEQLFEFPLSNRETLRYVVEKLLERLAWMLSRRCAGALRVACRFDCEGGAAAEFEVGLFQPTANPRHLLEIVELEMERLRLPAAAIAASLRAVRHAPLTQRQGVLFDQERNLESSLQLAALVNRLAGRLGRGAVVRCRLQRDAQPELAYVEDPLVDNPPPLKGGARGGISGVSKPSLARIKRAKKPSSSPQGRGVSNLAPLDRPLYLLRRPAPLETLSSVIPDGPPVQFRRDGQLHVVARHWGPERIETGWWRGQSAWRDYYRVETSEGRRFWLFRRRRDGRWFLHGMFG